MSAEAKVIDIENNTEDELEFKKPSSGELQESFENLYLACDELEFKDQAIKIKEKLNSLKDRLYVMVVGEGNFGKSTFINAYLKRDIAPVSIVPKTWKIDSYYSIQDSSSEHAVAYFVDSDPKKMSIDEAREYNNNEEKKSKEDKNYVSNLFEIKWHVHCPDVDEDICLIDTPGLGQLRSDIKVENLKIFDSKGIQIESNDPFEGYFHKADVVLWCFKAEKINAIQSFEKLKSIQKYNKPILGVITQMDKAPRERWDEVIDHAKSTYGDMLTTFLPSAIGKDLDLKDQTLSNIRKNVTSIVESDGIKERELLKSYRYEQNCFLERSLGVGNFYKVNLSIYNKITLEVEKTANTTLDNIDKDIVSLLENYESSLSNLLHGIWSKVEGRKDNRSGEFRRLFEMKINDNADLFGSIENTMNRHLTNLENELKTIFTNYHWEALELGSGAVETHSEEINIDLNIKKILKDISTPECNINGSEGGGQFALGGIAAVIGMAALGPIGIAAGLFGLLLKNEKEECISKARGAIEDKVNTVLQTVADQTNTTIQSIYDEVFDNISSSFHDFTGTTGTEEILPILTKIDGCLTLAGITPQSNRILNHKTLPKIEYYWMSIDYVTSDTDWMTSNKEIRLASADNICSKLNSEIADELSELLKSEKEITEVTFKDKVNNKYLQDTVHLNILLEGIDDYQNLQFSRQDFINLAVSHYSSHSDDFLEDNYNDLVKEIVIGNRDIDKCFKLVPGNLVDKIQPFARKEIVRQLNINSWSAVPKNLNTLISEEFEKNEILEKKYLSFIKSRVERYYDRSIEELPDNTGVDFKFSDFFGYSFKGDYEFSGNVPNTVGIEIAKSIERSVFKKYSKQLRIRYILD